MPSVLLYSEGRNDSYWINLQHLWRWFVTAFHCQDEPPSSNAPTTSSVRQAHYKKDRRLNGGARALPSPHSLTCLWVRYPPQFLVQPDTCICQLRVDSPSVFTQKPRPPSLSWGRCTRDKLVVFRLWLLNTILLFGGYSECSTNNRWISDFWGIGGRIYI